MIATSFVMRRLFATLKRLERSLPNVLLLGESGVGKELVARALHQASSLAGGPFVAKNCASMTRELIQSELFGHRRGAFTGAVESRVGAFEAAHGGTLFLDEIGELPAELQPMLLRVLESGEVTPVGSNETRRVQVRLVSATNRPIDDLSGDTLRRDLFYRVAVVTLRIAPLRERAEDIPLLADRFAQEANIPALPGEVLDRLTQHDWPGNVRELRNAIQAYAALGSLPDLRREKGELLDRALRHAADLGRPLMEQRDAILDQFTRRYLEVLLAHTGGNQSEAARVSGTERSHLRKLLLKHGLLTGLKARDMLVPTLP
ncbi:MAG TPA: sigma-54 dependent transcriptional regulator [Polyangiaceae bacterium]